MATATARVRATDGSRAANACIERSRLKAATSTTYPEPPTARKVRTSRVSSRPISSRHSMTLDDLLVRLEVSGCHRYVATATVMPDPLSDPLTELVPTPDQHSRQRLGDDGPRHLRRADCPVGERDGHLGDPEAEPDRTPGVLDLEAIPVRRGLHGADAFEGVAVERLEACGRVVHREPEDQADVNVAGPRDEASAR